MRFIASDKELKKAEELGLLDKGYYLNALIYAIMRGEADADIDGTIPQFPPPGVPHDEKAEERYRRHGPTDLQDHLSSFSVETLCDEFIEVIRRTNDFCNAKGAMLEAWERVINAEHEEGEDGYVDMDCQDRDIAYLVNRAWTMAKDKGFP